MSWQDRLRPEILLTSPSGRSFSAAWKQGPRSLEKKVGVFEYPGVKGADVQDLDVGAMRYPLTFYFDGPDNDLQADAFIDACRENGSWTVVHPVKGSLTLQLLSVSEEINPTESGNITEMKTEWIEFGIDLPARPAVAIAGVVRSQAGAFAASCRSQYAQFPVDVVSVSSAVTALVAVLRITSGSALSASQGVKVGILAASPDALALSAGVQTMISQSGASTFDLKTLIATPITGAAVQEVILLAALTQLSLGALTAPLNSRKDALDYIETLIAALDAITQTLDAQQLDGPLSTRYFSFSQTYNDAVQLVMGAVEYLLRVSYDLAIAYYFKLDRDRAPVEIAISSYGDLGALDTFIDTNNLTGTDILLLHAGREVVVYLS